MGNCGPLAPNRHSGIAALGNFRALAPQHLKPYSIAVSARAANGQVFRSQAPLSSCRVWHGAGIASNKLVATRSLPKSSCLRALRQTKIAKCPT